MITLVQKAVRSMGTFHLSVCRINLFHSAIRSAVPTVCSAAEEAAEETKTRIMEGPPDSDALFEADLIRSALPSCTVNEQNRPSWVAAIFDTDSVNVF